MDPALFRRPRRWWLPSGFLAGLALGCLAVGTLGAAAWGLSPRVEAGFLVTAGALLALLLYRAFARAVKAVEDIGETLGRISLALDEATEALAGVVWHLDARTDLDDQAASRSSNEAAA
jgi:membrane protein implicated in regulation of membrane protease activity